MPDPSKYLRYLPPVLWENEPSPSGFSLGAMLLGFEKLLSGINDGEVIRHVTRDRDGTETVHEHEGIETVISRLHRLFDPWAAPPEFLDWLASWVSLSFSPQWDEYQRRKVTAAIVQIYNRRGLKEGLDRYLDLYTVAKTRPRIVVDDGSKLLFTRPEAGRFAAVSTLLSQGPYVRVDTDLDTAAVRNRTPLHEGLIRPQCLALEPGGSLLVGDAGAPENWPDGINVQPGVWRILAEGHYEYEPYNERSPNLPKPRRIGPTGWTLESPRALVIDNRGRLYVLDAVNSADTPALYLLESQTGFNVATPLAMKRDLGTQSPVAMALDANGHLLILDQGPPLAFRPKIIDVDVLTGTTARGIPRNLEMVQTPLSFLVLPGGNLIVGDARERDRAGPADLVFVDRTNPARWTERRLLEPATVERTNPLTAPTAVVDAGDNRFYVLDVGLKPLVSSSGRTYAEPAAVYAVDLARPVPAVVRATETGRLVYPRGMVRDGATLYIGDSGDHQEKPIEPRVWPARFAVFLHFSNQRPTTPQDRQRIVSNIREIVEREKPAHTLWTVVAKT